MWQVCSEHVQGVLLKHCLWSELHKTDFTRACEIGYIQSGVEKAFFKKSGVSVTAHKIREQDLAWTAGCWAKWHCLLDWGKLREGEGFVAMRSWGEGQGCGFLLSCAIADSSFTQEWEVDCIWKPGHWSQRWYPGCLFWLQRASVHFADGHSWEYRCKLKLHTAWIVAGS